MLVGMDLIRSYRNEILHQITDAHSFLQLPILLHFDRDCLEQTLPQCEAFDFLIRRLENQVDQHGGVVLRWEHRGSAFMRIIDRQAKEATQMKVCPMRRSFDPDFINILNGNRPFCVEIQRMQVAWRSEYHAPRVQNRIRKFEPASWKIVQGLQTPEQYDKFQEKPATERSS